MPEVSLIATLPQAALVATSLGIEGLGWHRSPGSAKFFHGRSVFLEVAHAEGKPTFEFLDEGGWRDAASDTAAAIKSILAGKRTKTALSNNALNCIPIDAVKKVYLVKTSGRALQLNGPKELHVFKNHQCDEGMTPERIAQLIERQPNNPVRSPRFYMVLAPLELLVVSNLTPIEYAWYASHRPGKIFRQVVFSELVGIGQRSIVSESVLKDAVAELATKTTKKTKTVYSGELLNRFPFQDWAGYGNPNEGGLYLANREKIVAYRFPEPIHSQWARSDG